MLADTTPPLISNIITTPLAARSFGTAAVQSVNVIATVSDTGGSGGPIDVTALFTIDGVHWKSSVLTKGSGNIYQGTYPDSAEPVGCGSDHPGPRQRRQRQRPIAQGPLSDAFSVTLHLPTIMR